MCGQRYKLSIISNPYYTSKRSDPQDQVLKLWHDALIPGMLFHNLVSTIVQLATSTPSEITFAFVIGTAYLVGSLEREADPLPSLEVAHHLPADLPGSTVVIRFQHRGVVP